jgi:RNA polymerase sigma factor (sigma-70 family)
MMPGSFDQEFGTLIGPFRAKEPVAVNRVLELIRPKIRNFASAILPRKIRHRADGSDLAQDALCKISRNASDFRGSTIHEFWGWAFWQVRDMNSSLIEKHVEAQGRAVGREVAGVNAENILSVRHGVEPSPSEVYQQKETLEELFRILPEAERVVMYLLYTDGYTLEQAAGFLTSSVAEVNYVRMRALKLLRKKTRPANT